jgi:multidrug resistance efflux pump
MMKRSLLPLIAAAGLLFATASTIAHRSVDKTTAPPVAPPETTGPRTVAAVGVVEAPTEDIQLSCAVSGMVTALSVKAGDRVRTGQPLFAVDDRDLRADLGVKQASLANARAQLARLEAQPRPEELPPLEAKVREANALLQDAEVQVQLIESVSDNRAVKKEDVLRRRQNYEAAKARLGQAEKDLALTKAGAWAPDLAVARTQVAQAAAAVHQDEVNLDRLITRAPIDGIILQNKVRLGQYAQCGPLSEPLMIFGGTGLLHVRASVDEADAWRVPAGAPAVARVRGNSQRTYSLNFVRFEPALTPKKSLTGDSTERVDTRVLEVVYAFEGDAPVYDGQQLDVFIADARPMQPETDR